MARAVVVFNVDTVDDRIDDDLSDGECHASMDHDHCSLRAAIMQANRVSGAGATIVLPAGIYGLVRPAANGDGEDNGDLNLTTPAIGSPSITIIGASPALTIIDANQIDRVLSVGTSRSVSISHITFRNGLTLGLNVGGGGILNKG